MCHFKWFHCSLWCCLHFDCSTVSAIVLIYIIIYLYNTPTTYTWCLEVGTGYRTRGRRIPVLPLFPSTEDPLNGRTAESSLCNYMWNNSKISISDSWFGNMMYTSTSIHSCWSSGTIDFTLSFITNVMNKVSILHTFRSWCSNIPSLRAYCVFNSQSKRYGRDPPTNV